MDQLIDLQPYLEESLVIFEPLNLRDYNDLYEVASNAEIWEQHPANDGYIHLGFLKFFEESINSSGALVIKDRASGKVIGSSRFKLIDATDRIVEIGWTFLTKQFWGGKYNRATKKLMVNYILNDSGTVVLHADKNSIRSQRAISKIGADIIKRPHFKMKVLRSNILEDPVISGSETTTNSYGQLSGSACKFFS